MENTLILSTLPKTWVFDLDGTIVKHNGYKTEGRDTLLPGVEKFFNNVPEEDKIIFFTSRTEEYREATLQFLKEHAIRFDKILFNMPMGERILVNDRKVSGLDMAVSINIDRDQFIIPKIVREK